MLTKKRAFSKLVYNNNMSTVQQKDQKKTIENILQLQPLRDKLRGADLKKLDSVIGDMRRSVGDTVTKSNAAEMLDVSRQTLDKWIKQDVLPTVKGQNGRDQIPRQVVEKLTEEVRRLKDTGHTRSVLAKALRNVADEIDPAHSALAKSARPSEDFGKGEVDDLEDIGS